MMHRTLGFIVVGIFVGNVFCMENRAPDIDEYSKKSYEKKRKWAPVIVKTKNSKKNKLEKKEELKEKEEGLVEKKVEEKEEWLSQTEAYLKVRSYETLRDNLGIDPMQFDDMIKQLIKNEKERPGDYTFYHGLGLDVLILILLNTDLAKIKYNLNGDDEFYQLRSQDDFFQEDITPEAFLEKYYSPFKLRNGTSFDRSTEGIKWLLCVNFSFFGSSYNRATSTLDFFARGGSLNSFDELFPIFIKAFKKYNPTLFDIALEDADLKKIQEKIRTFIFIKLKRIIALIGPRLSPDENEKLKKLEQSKELSSNEEKAFNNLKIKQKSINDLKLKSAALFQIFIPKSIVDDCVYPNYGDGTPLEVHIEGMDEGWDSKNGMYTKISPFIEKLKKDPDFFGKTALGVKDRRNLVDEIQGRLFLKKKYFYKDSREQNNIIMKLFHTMPQSLFTVLTDRIRELARIIIQTEKVSKSKKDYMNWFETSNIEHILNTLGDPLPHKEDDFKSLDDILKLVKLGFCFDFAQKEVKKSAFSENITVVSTCQKILKALLDQGGGNIDWLKETSNLLASNKEKIEVLNKKEEKSKLLEGLESEDSFENEQALIMLEFKIKNGDLCEWAKPQVTQILMSKDSEKVTLASEIIKQWLTLGVTTKEKLINLISRVKDSKDSAHQSLVINLEKILKETDKKNKE